MCSFLYLPTRYFPSISGAEFYFQRIAEILTKLYNYKIDIYTSNAIDFTALHSQKGKRIKKSNHLFGKVNDISIKRYPIDYNLTLDEKIRFIKSFESFQNLNLSDICLKNIISSGPFIPKLIEILLHQENEYDLIHTTYYPYFNLIIALIAGEKMKCPTICTPFFHFTNPRYLKKEPTEILTKFDFLIACTQMEKEFLYRNLNIDPERIKVIPMGVDYRKINNFNNNVSFKEKFFNKTEKSYKMVLYCGYKNYEKGAISLLKSIPLIIKDHSELYFVFIGPPTQAFNRELSKVRKLEKARIINLTPDNLTGYFDKYKLSAFKETDIYVMPSRSDAFGIAYLEAWASGKPVIAADIGAIPEVVKNENDGLLVKFDDINDIKTNILKLLRNESLRKKLGKTGEEKVKNNFTWKIIAEKTHKFYNSIINKSIGKEGS
ncbi:MAG: glycosyltransferase [Candidatus Lokiarchaeota archaeon]|nr:glycosyltransferase [Candidatus Lokiarchaeota archaeon]